MPTGNPGFIRPFSFSRFFLSQLILCLLVLCISRGAYASSLEFLIEEQGQKITQSTQVENDHVLLRKAGGDAATDILFDASKTILYVINHKDKSYMRIDNKVVNEISALMDTVSDVVGSQQGVLADLLSTFGIGDKPKPGKKAQPKVTLTDSGKDLSIGGARCRLYQAMRNDQLQAEACFAQPSALKVDAAEYATLKKFAEFGNLLLSRAGPLLDVLGVTVPAVQMQSVPGVPVGLNDQLTQRKVKLVEITGIQGLDGMRVPDGYSQTAIPFTSG